MTHHRKFLLIVLACALLCCVAGPGDGRAQGAAQENLVCILDASGSMWGQVGGKTKIEIAKQTLASLIRGLPDALPVGLVAYGHRAKGDCGDVEMLVPLRPLDKDGLIKHIDGLNPKGKTPLTESVRKTAEDLRTVEGKTTILLVSDGKETCAGDPCALVRELKASGVHFVLDVIGFDVTEEERQQLECMAQAGGGTYYNAADADQFRQAIADTAMQRTLAAGKLHLATTRNGKNIKAHVSILDPDTGEQIDHDWSYLDLGFTRMLKPGTYILDVTDDQAADAPTQRLELTIDGGETLEKTVDFSSGVILLAPVFNGEPLEAYIEVFKADGGERVLRTFSDNSQHVAKLVLPPGVYDVAVKSSKTKDEPIKMLERQEVMAGKEDSATVAFESGQLEVRTLLRGREILAEVTVLTPGGDIIWFEKCAPGKPASFRLSPGNYALSIGDVQAGQPTEGAERVEGAEVPEVAVEAGGVSKVDVELGPQAGGKE